MTVITGSALVSSLPGCQFKTVIPPDLIPAPELDAMHKWHAVTVDRHDIVLVPTNIEHGIEHYISAISSDGTYVCHRLKDWQPANFPKGTPMLKICSAIEAEH